MVISDEITWRSYLADLIWNVLPVSSYKVRTRDQMNFRCPICGDSKKSATKKRGFYYISTASYHCFNCEAHMTGLSLLKHIAPENVFHEAISKYNQLKLSSLDAPQSIDSFTQEGELIPCEPIPAWKILIDEFGWSNPYPLNNEMVTYLQSRGMSQEQLVNFLGIDNPKGIPCILILYKYLGDCIFYQLHNYTKAELRPGQIIKYVFPNSIDLNGQDKPIFNIDDVDPTWPFLIACEGVYDALSYKNGISLGGSVVTDYQWRLLKERWPHHTLVLAFDNDETGKKRMLKMCAKNDNRIKFLNTFPLFDKFKVKDANEFIQLGNKAKQVLQNTQFLEKSMMSALEMKINLMLD